MVKSGLTLNISDILYPGAPILCRDLGWALEENMAVVSTYDQGQHGSTSIRVSNGIAFVCVPEYDYDAIFWNKRISPLHEYCITG